jgi:hypothetical protein
MGLRCPAGSDYARVLAHNSVGLRHAEKKVVPRSSVAITFAFLTAPTAPRGE